MNNPAPTNQVKTALISVSDKSGIVDFAKKLSALNIQILSTGGTAKLLQEAGLKVKEVSEHTGFPEMLDGRVKTLHPTIHGGLLARRDIPEHLQALEAHHISQIDLLVVNLYPFEATVARPDCTLEDAIENIDIGGPAMVRSAAKNWQGVGVLTHHSQYQLALDEIGASGALSHTTRFQFAIEAFNRIAEYDAAISNYLSGLTQGGSPAYPSEVSLNYQKIQNLRYGENPHQNAAYYQDLNPLPGSLACALQLHGKELSYNNIADADAAWECVKSFSSAPSCVIIKHANPCGVAVGANAKEAYLKAFKADPTSAFGGIIAFNTKVDEAAAQQVNQQFVEVIIAPSYTDAALEELKSKKNTRILQIDITALMKDGMVQWELSRNQYDLKRVGSSLLIQDADHHQLQLEDLKVVTKKQPTKEQLDDLLFAWKVAQYTKSNAIVFCADGMTLGVGAGQMSRVDSARIASIKAENAGLSLQNSAVASDAFFPFRDGLDVVVNAGASCIIQPGGSIRDDEVIAAANEHGVVMVFSGVRHFRH